MLRFRITIDLNTAKDLAFHFNPRFNEAGKAVIVRNSCIGQAWGKEERQLQNFPFVRGQPFEVSSFFSQPFVPEGTVGDQADDAFGFCGCR